MQNDPHTTLVTPTAPIATHTHGGRAKCLQRLSRLDLPVPTTVALSFDSVHRIATGALPDLPAILSQFPAKALLCVRPSSADPDWGGPGAVLNIGMNTERYTELCQSMGRAAATALYTRFVQSFSVHVARLDPDMFDGIDGEDEAALQGSLAAFETETEEAFPEDPDRQLAAVLKSMARAWESTTARLLRQAKGAPADAGLGLVIQQMVLGVGRGISGAGVLQLVSSDTGQSQITGRYQGQSQGRDAMEQKGASLYLTRDARGPSLQDLAPQLFDELTTHAALMRRRLREEMQVEFTIENGKLYILDGVRVDRSPKAALQIAVDLAEDGIISRNEALMRVEPRALNELLHPQIAPRADRHVFGQGIAASPGAATGKVVFSPTEAQVLAARREDCVLVRRETSPEDIRGMHAAVAVLTERGGITSHAAVIGRGIGLPCVVGASDIRFNLREKTLTAPDGRILREGDTVTIDGTSGQILLGAPRMVPAGQGAAFQTFMQWADQVRDIAIRANADTPADAATARAFGAEGIGLCRTEHMFFDDGRRTLMREMIFAEEESDRRAVLDRLLPLQRADFAELFKIMSGAPVCIRLFDPPLHEFLPADRPSQRELAEALNLPLSAVTNRIDEMHEYNPMLGLRGVRLGVTVPEIYEMQVRAIFEATVETSLRGMAVVPEIMLPLVSARREVELIETSIKAIAAAVRAERQVAFDYRLGVMVETPRAALRAGELAQHCTFLSFGTNDLTQMTYGLSRDDAGRFLGDYVARAVFDEDPFHMLDVDGVGELLRLGSQRAREVRGDVTLSICGEHGGNPESIAFCRSAGFDYVSCSPFRVPIARLAAAQLAIADAAHGP